MTPKTTLKNQQKKSCFAIQLKRVLFHPNFARKAIEKKPAKLEYIVKADDYINNSK